MIPKSRWEKILCLLGPLLAALVLLATFLRGADRTDLSIFLRAARNLESGRPVYNLSDPNEHTKPPLATVLFIPLTRVEPSALGRIWDAMNVLLLIGMAFFFVRRLVRRRPPATLTWVVLTILWLLNPWNKEIRLGQYNLLTFAFVLLAGLARPRMLSGALATLAVLMKPTNVFFVPWIWSQTSARRAFVLSAAILTLALAAGYLWIAGPRALVDDHRVWLWQLPLSTAKHLHRTDNYGLVRILDEAGARTALLGVQAVATLLLLGTAFFADWITGLCLASIVGILLTPMAWFQNYVLLLPWVVLLFARAFAKDAGWLERVFCGVSLLCLYLGLQIFPALAGQGLLHQFSDLPVPLWSLLGALIAWALSIVAAPLRRVAPQTA